MQEKRIFFSQGFTFIEMLIVSFIIGLVSAILVANIRSGNNVANLRFSAQNLSETLKQAQSMTLSGKTVGGNVPQGGYGVRIVLNSTSDQDRFLLCANNQLHNYEPCGSSDRIIERIALSASNITIQAYIDGTLSTSDFVDIAFTSPSGAIYIDGAAGRTLRIVFRNSNGQTSETNIDSKTGLIQ